MVVEPKGSRHRIDLAAISEDLLAAVDEARVLTGTPIAVEAALDHLPVSVSVVLAKGQAVGATARPLYKRGLLRLPSMQDQVAAFWMQVPSVPASFGLAAKTLLLVKCCRIVLAAL